MGIVILIFSILIILGTVTFFKKEEKMRRSYGEIAAIIRPELSLGQEYDSTTIFDYVVSIPKNKNKGIFVSSLGRYILTDKVEIVYDPDDRNEYGNIHNAQFYDPKNNDHSKLMTYDPDKYSNKVTGGIICGVAISIVLLYCIIYFTRKS